jgi:hypothetical protein
MDLRALALVYNARVLVRLFVGRPDCTGRVAAASPKIIINIWNIETPSPPRSTAFQSFSLWVLIPHAPFQWIATMVCIPLLCCSGMLRKSNNSQLDQLIGFAMLVAASVVFLYYSIWTLLMVCMPCIPFRLYSNALFLALCRLGPSSPEHLPSSSLGYPHTCHTYSPGLSCCGILLERGHDPEQQKEGSQGKGRWKEEGVRGVIKGESVEPRKHHSAWNDHGLSWGKRSRWHNSRLWIF